MDRDEREQLLTALESGSRALMDALSGISEEAARRSPGDGSWSVLECVEHLGVTEDYLFSLILNAQALAAAVVNSAREAAILQRGPDRTRRVQAPDAARPTGRFITLADAAQHFAASRARTVEFVRRCTGDLRAQSMKHPVLGEVNCYENLLLMAIHPQRHAKQIEEIKAALK